MALFHWGAEVTNFGLSKFYAKVGDGRDILITRIDGAATSTPQQGCTYLFASDKPRNALVSLSCNRPNDPVVTTVDPVTKGAGNYNNEVDGALFAVNTKCIGLDNMAVPIAFGFNPPVVAPGGALTLAVVNVSSVVPPTSNKDSPDIEIHMTIQWQYGP